MLAKSLRPPPEKHHGLQDVETRYRRRELDLMANEDARELFIARAKVVTAVRRYLDDAGFIEVETPVLQPLYGGALARPFTTHHNALDRTLYLRIATELYLKRCIVGGLERVYELGKDFRNEGLSTKHNPEFTMVEFYEAYADYNDVADRLETLVRSVAQQVGSVGAIDFAARRGGASRCATRSSRRPASTSSSTATATSLAAAIGDRLPTDERTWPQLVDDLLSQFVEPELQQPTFLMDYPVELSPFAKAHRSSRASSSAGRRSAAASRSPTPSPSSTTPTSSARGLSPRPGWRPRATRRRRPTTRSSSRRSSTGMPPTGGVGLGIDRLVMALRDRSSIREVVLFPAMRECMSARTQHFGTLVRW